VADTSKTGIWVDTKTGKVVETQPEEGVQLVAPGGEVTDRAADLLKAGSVERATAPADAETATVTSTPTRRR
jgi:hypothetical protein